MEKIHVQDRTGQPSAINNAEYFRQREESKPKCTGLAVLARCHCANWGICGNCRLCANRLERCAYFEWAVLPGLIRKDAERYAATLGVALEKARHGLLRVAAWDTLPAGAELSHAA